MTRAAGILCLLTFLVTAGTSSGMASSLDCAGGIVSDGDTRMDLLMKCGEPDAKESHDEVISDRPGPGVRRKLFITVEEWTYNFGPGQFMRIVTLKNGTVSDIRTGNYGSNRSSKPDQRECGERIVSIGDSKSDVLAKCGEPAGKDSREEAQSELPGAGTMRRTYVTIEEWTYNFGPNRFVRIFTFRNGIVTDIRTGGYGYEMKREEKRKTP
jgi:uncharacterized protein DUF2845